MATVQPQLTEAEFFDYCDDTVSRIITQEELHQMFGEVDPEQRFGAFSDWFRDLSESEDIRLEYIISAEEYLPDDYVTDWDILHQYDPTDAGPMLQAKATQKFKQYIKERIAAELNTTDTQA